MDTIEIIFALNPVMEGESTILYIKSEIEEQGFTDLVKLTRLALGIPRGSDIEYIDDSLTMKPSNPFKPVSHGEFTPESLKLSPRTFQPYILQIDTSISIDTTINRRGAVVKVDTDRVLGTKYFLEDPDGYGTVGDLTNDALKNTSSWE